MAEQKQREDIIEYEDGCIYKVGEKIRQRSLSEMFWNMIITSDDEQRDHINGCEAVELNGDHHKGLVYFVVDVIDENMVKPRMILNKEKNILIVDRSVLYRLKKLMMNRDDSSELSLEEFVKGEIKECYGFDGIDQVQPSPDVSMYPDVMAYISVGAYKRLKERTHGVRRTNELKDNKDTN